ncbi:MAG: AMP-dependent synthetase [Betaproteobacteria bacterium RIFCSPLOWO2_12_FULL_65_110]|nr:MAG: AMP-dependent synthetase [Betaproteobacteria bacterium RIFCSPLOWO2_12_FULL_65_110]
MVTAGSTAAGFNLARLLVRSARAYPHQPALALGDAVTATYLQLADRVARMAGALGSRLAPGDRVALVMGNCPQYVEVLFACWHAGLAAVPINAKLHPKELEFILSDSGARACFVTAGHAGAVSSLSSAVPALSHVIEAGSADYERLSACAPIVPAARAADDVAWLFYTSGTTGRPKGVMITHRNLMAMTLGYFADVDAIEPGDSILHAAPMSHGSGLYVLPHVAHAALNVAPESGGFDPDEVYALIRRWRGATLFAAPTMVKRLVDHRRDADTANLKTLVYGGGPMYVEECKRALARFGHKLAQIYGQGESPMTITAMGKGLHADIAHLRYEQRLASVGLPQTGIEVAIAGGGDEALAAGATGEVLVRGDAVMLGYWQNEAATAETLRGGWLHTGDVGSLDEEGFLTLRDRSKDVIISGGSNIYPREVEEVLLRHAAVSEVSVVGEQDPEWGENVVAFVVAKQGARLDAADLDRLCLEHIARFKRPKRYQLIAALPKNTTGKVLKTELRKLLAQRGPA